VGSAIAGQRVDPQQGADRGATPTAGISRLSEAERRTAAASGGIGRCPNGARDRSRSHADRIGGNHIALLRHLRTRRSVDRSIPSRPTPTARRPKFRKLRFQMIADNFG